jgi:hypothetical protein
MIHKASVQACLQISSKQEEMWFLKYVDMTTKFAAETGESVGIEDFDRVDFNAGYSLAMLDVANRVSDISTASERSTVSNPQVSITHKLIDYSGVRAVALRKESLVQYTAAVVKHCKAEGIEPASKPVDTADFAAGYLMATTNLIKDLHATIAAREVVRAPS